MIRSLLFSQTNGLRNSIYDSIAFLSLVTLVNPCPEGFFLKRYWTRFRFGLANWPMSEYECKKTFECFHARSSFFIRGIVIQYGESFLVLREFGDDFLNDPHYRIEKGLEDLGLIREAN